MYIVGNNVEKGAVCRVSHKNNDIWMLNDGILVGINIICENYLKSDAVYCN